MCVSAHSKATLFNDYYSRALCSLRLQRLAAPAAVVVTSVLPTVQHAGVPEGSASLAITARLSAWPTHERYVGVNYCKRLPMMCCN